MTTPPDRPAGPSEWTPAEAVGRLQDLFADQSVSASADVWIEAAAVLASFDPETIHPCGDAGSDGPAGRAELLAQSTETRIETGEVRWMLEPHVRRRALQRLISEGRLDQALAANRHVAATTLQQAFEDLLRAPSAAPARRDPAYLSAHQAALDWLHGLLPGLPDPRAVAEQVELARLLEPFRQLVGDYFAGREAELLTLADYVGVLDASGAIEGIRRATRSIFSLVHEPPLFVYGPGGIGKSTLIARFVLNHIDRPDVPRFPFAYLDLDRSGLVPEEPITLLMEALRQLAVQYPHAAPGIAELLRTWNTRFASAAGSERLSARPFDQAKAHERGRRAATARPSEPAAATTGGCVPRKQRSQRLWTSLRLTDRDYYIEGFCAAVRELQQGAQPMLLVVDTFEEVQLRSAALVADLFALLESLQQRLPFLRTVLSGRVATAPPGFSVKELPLRIFDHEAATAYITARARVDAATAAAVARQVTGSPLTLNLAVDLLAKERAGAAGFESISGGLLGALWKGSIEAQLYSRVLGHIEDPDVRRLAHPGLVMRRITPAIIKEVLAVPCGVAVPDQQTATTLFDRLRAEVVLVIDRGGGVVEHRLDLRAVMLDTLRRAEPQRVAEIHRRAIAYYETLPSPSVEERAEEIYHRLVVGAPRTVLEARWMPGVERRLTGTMAELPGRAQAFLAARLDLALDPSLWAEADLPDWETHAIREVTECLRVGRLDAAQAVLEERSDWTSPTLRELLVEVLARRGELTDAGAVAHETIARTPSDSERIRILEELASLSKSTGASPETGGLSSQDLRALVDALQDAFGRSEPLVALLPAYGLPDVTPRLPARHDEPESRYLARLALALTTIASSQRWLVPLVLAARRARPENLRLWRAAQALGLTARGYPESDAEGFAAAMRIKAQPAQLRRQLTRLEGQTCFVLHASSTVTTGVLVGPDLVLASERAAGTVTQGPAWSSDVSLIFDGWTTDTGLQPQMPFIQVPVARDGIVARGGTSGPSYVLIRIATRIGDGPGAMDGRRGWVKLTAADLPARSFVGMLRYDTRRAMHCSHSPTGMRERKSVGHLRYELEADAGAAGAPVFDDHLRVIGIHEGGDASWWRNRLPGRHVHDGIAAHAIQQDLERQHVSLPEPPGSSA